MRCPTCKSNDHYVKNTDSDFDDITTRERRCRHCNEKFGTKEVITHNLGVGKVPGDEEEIKTVAPYNGIAGLDQ